MRFFQSLVLFSSVLGLLVGCGLPESNSTSTTIRTPPTRTVTVSPTKIPNVHLGEICYAMTNVHELSQILHVTVTNIEAIAGNISGKGFWGACLYELVPYQQIVAIVSFFSGSDISALNASKASITDDPAFHGTIASVDDLGVDAFATISPADGQGKEYRIYALDGKFILSVELTSALGISDDSIGLPLVKQLASIVLSRV